MKLDKDFYFNLIVGTSVSLFALLGSYKLTQVVFEGKSYLGTVVGQNITTAEFKEKFAAIKKQQGAMSSDFKTENGRNQYFEVRNNVMQDIILTKIIMAQAVEKKIEFTDQQIEDEIKMVKVNTFKNNEEAFQKAMKKNNFTLPKLREIIRERNTIKLVIDKLIDENVKVTEKDLLDFYNSKKDSEFTTKEQVEAAHILVKDEALAKQIIDELNKGGDFDALAKKHSVDPGSKESGGKLGYFAKGDMVKEFADASWELQVGDITSKPVKTQFGFHIIKKTGLRPASVMPFSDVKEKISGELKNMKQTEFFQKWREKMLKETEVKPKPEFESFFPAKKEEKVADKKDDKSEAKLETKEEKK
ncbi:MAG: peptidylprolyl isomerase [Candidatus Sericytochromatia bacterium]